MGDLQELEAIVVSFLTAELQKHPTGFSLNDFERMFPEAVDESRTWYTRYNKQNVLEAVKCIKSGVKVYSRNNTTWISLDRNSDNVDSHLIDLITHQKDSRKKKGPSRPSSRAYASFSLNQHYKTRSGGSNHFYRQNDYSHRGPVTSGQAGPSYSETSYRPPRNNQHMMPPQVQMKTYPPARQPTYTPPTYAPPTYAPPTYAPPTHAPPTRPSALPRPVIHQPPTISSPSPTTKPFGLSSRSTNEQTQPSIQTPKVPARLATARPIATENRRIPESGHNHTAKKEQLRQKLVHLLTYKHQEINVLHLSALYKLQFEETLNPAEYGHKAITDLIQDPIIGANVKFVFKSPFPTIRARSLSPLNERQNITSYDDCSHSSAPTKRYSSADCFAIQAKLLSPAKQKLDAIDIFNVRTMLQNLESIPV